MRTISKILDKLLATLFADKWKKYSELRYWKKQKSNEEVLSNDHYSYSYTEHFTLDKEFYSNKKVLDIGCGPRGSLEWADNAEQRVGLDPLADEYLKLGANKHAMEYFTAPSESMPFEDAHFEVVCSFNSLDHVESLEQTISEIKRVTKKKGHFLLLVEINHEPTSCEPHMIKPLFYESLLPEFELLDLRFYDSHPNGLYRSLSKDQLIEKSPFEIKQTCWMSAMFVRK